MKPAAQIGPFALLSATGGYLVWSVAFVVLYSVQGLICAGALFDRTVLGIDANVVLLIGLWMGHLAVGTVLVWIGWKLTAATRHDRRTSAAFVYRIGCLLAVAGLVSTIYIGAPIVALDPCI